MRHSNLPWRTGTIGLSSSTTAILRMMVVLLNSTGYVLQRFYYVSVVLEGQVAGTCEYGEGTSGSKMRGISWLDAEPVSFSRRTLLHGVSKYWSPALLIQYKKLLKRHITLTYCHMLQPTWRDKLKLTVNIRLETLMTFVHYFYY
jgi:hypothetical protein